MRQTDMFEKSDRYDPAERAADMTIIAQQKRDAVRKALRMRTLCRNAVLFLRQRDPQNIDPVVARETDGMPPQRSRCPEHASRVSRGAWPRYTPFFEPAPVPAGHLDT
jgi:hypothetical protein